MRIIIIFLGLISTLPFSLLAQPENVTIKNESGIDQLVEKHIYYNEVQETINGYRVHIFSASGTGSKSGAMNERSRFMGRYPHIKAYLIFNTPYYLVRVGNFRTRIEAECFRQQIIDHYPEVYIVRDDIDLPGKD